LDINDIEDVVVAALTQEGHEGRLYEVTDPILLSVREAMEEISKVTGRESRFEQVSIEQYEEMLVEHQILDDFTWLINYLFTNVLDGRNASVTEGVHQAQRHDPKDFENRARETAETGIWSSEPVSAQTRTCRG